LGKLVVGLAQLRRRRDAERPHEVLHVEAIGAPGAGALLLLQPDFFFGDVGELGDGRDPPATRCRSLRSSRRSSPPCFFFGTLDYHVGAAGEATLPTSLLDCDKGRYH
jgi:hypothetical protein